jgi:8-oxo-dGTP diphosphatase
MNGRFNIRAYGIWVHDDKMLVNEEFIRGQYITKFPGGGVHWGEGIADGLAREWKEELGIDINILGHFYTTDFFQASAYDDSQVISIYYWVAANEVPETITNLEERERTYWMNVKDVSGDTFTLAIDKIVGSLLQKHFSQLP